MDALPNRPELKPGELFYAIDLSKATLNSFWFVSINPKSDRLWVAIDTCNVTRLVTIGVRDKVYINYEAACKALIEASAERHRLVVELYSNPQEHTGTNKKYATQATPDIK